MPPGAAACSAGSTPATRCYAGAAQEAVSMPNTSAGAGKVSWLAEPTYGYASSDGGPYLPTPREVIREWLDAINVVANRNRGSALLFILFHLLTAVVFVASFF